MNQKSVMNLERKVKKLLSLGFAHGLTKRMEFGIGLEYLTGQVPSFSSPELSLKYELLTEWISVSFLSRFGESAYSLNGIITQTFGYFEIDGNCGYSVGDTTITYGVAVIYKMEKFDIGIETRGDREGLENWLIGGRYKIFEGFAVDFGLSREVSPEAFKKTFGVHYEF